MKPLEAWGIISQCMDELIRMRKATWNGGQHWSHIENQAQVIAFEALRKMEEDGEQDDRMHIT